MHVVCTNFITGKHRCEFIDTFQVEYMDEQDAFEEDEVIVSSESEDDEDDGNTRGCASSYLVEERESSNKILPHKFRERWTRAATLLAIVSFIATVGFSLSSFITSQATESSAVFAAGFDAFFAAINVVAVCWRFRDEINGDTGALREKRATSVIAATFILGGIATIAISLYHLKIKDHPMKTSEMVIVLTIGFVIYSVLCFCQCYIAIILRSASMKALAVDSGLAAAMAIGLLGSTWIFREKKSLWFLDHAVAAFLGVVSLIYGVILVIEIIEFKIKGKVLLSFQREF